MDYFHKKVTGMKFANYLDKRILIGFVYVLFVVVQALSYLRSNINIDRSLTLFAFYCLAPYFYYQKRTTLKFSNNLSAQILGIILCGLVLVKLLTLAQVDVYAFWILAPPVFILGLILLADGFRGIKQFWRLIFGIFFVCGLIQALIRRFVDISLISAKLSAYFLWMIGFDSVSDGTLLFVNNGVVDVYIDCTVLPLFFSSLELLIIIWLFFPKYISNLFFYVVCAFLITFPLSLVRIAIMALVVNDDSAFNFWHGADGSNIFMSISLLALSGIIIFRSPSHVSVDPSIVLLRDTYHPKNSVLVTLTVLVATFLLGYIIISSYGGALRISGYQFPDQINLTNWDFEYSRQLSLTEIEALTVNKNEMLTKEKLLRYQTEQKNTNTIMAVRRFFYNSITDNSNLNSSLYYVINADGRFPGLENSNFSDFNSEVLQKALDNNSPPKEYVEFTDNSKDYLVSCISPAGKGFVDPKSFVLASRILQTLLNPVYLYQWVIGQKIMWDKRCVWTQLSIDHQTDNSDNQLKNAWEELVTYWQLNFPAI